MVKVSEEAGLQILGPDDVGIKIVRISSWIFSSLIVLIGFIALDSKPSIKALFLSLMMARDLNRKDDPKQFFNETFQYIRHLL